MTHPPDFQTVASALGRLRRAKSSGRTRAGVCACAARPSRRSRRR